MSDTIPMVLLWGLCALLVSLGAWTLDVGGPIYIWAAMTAAGLALTFVIGLETATARETEQKEVSDATS